MKKIISLSLLLSAVQAETLRSRALEYAQSTVPARCEWWETSKSDGTLLDRRFYGRYGRAAAIIEDFEREHGNCPVPLSSIACYVKSGLISR